MRFIKPKFFSSKACVECKNYIYDTKQCKLFYHNWNIVDGKNTYEKAFIVRNKKCGIKNPIYFKSDLENLKKNLKEHISNNSIYLTGFFGSLGVIILSFPLMIYNNSLWGILALVFIVPNCYFDNIAKNNIKLRNVIEERIKIIEDFNNKKTFNKTQK